VRRQLAFTVTSHSAVKGALSWRRGASSTNLLLPDGGDIAENGPTSVAVDELVLDNQTVIEVVNGAAVLATLTVRSR
jgi:hypothetical protein